MWGCLAMLGSTLQRALPEAHLRRLLAQLCVARVIELRAQRKSKGRSPVMFLVHGMCWNNILLVLLMRLSTQHLTRFLALCSNETRQARAGAHRVLAAKHGVQHHAAAPHWRTPHACSVSQPANLTWQQSWGTAFLS